MVPIIIVVCAASDVYNRVALFVKKNIAWFDELWVTRILSVVLPDTCACVLKHVFHLEPMMLKKTVHIVVSGEFTHVFR